MAYTIRIEHFPGQLTAIVRRRAALKDLPTAIPQACGLVWDALKRAQVKDAGRLVAVYTGQAGGQFDIEIGAEIGNPFAGAGEVVESALPAGRVATVTYLGPYQNLADIHQSVRDWCAAQNHQLAGPCWETYGHWLPEWKDDPSKIRTDVYYLLKS